MRTKSDRTTKSGLTYTTLERVSQVTSPTINDAYVKENIELLKNYYSQEHQIVLRRMELIRYMRGLPMTFQAIADYLSIATGRDITKQRVSQILLRGGDFND